MRFRTLLLVVATAGPGLAAPGSLVAQSPDRLLPDLSVPTVSVIGEARQGTCNRFSVAVHNGGNKAAQDVALDVDIYNQGYLEDFNESRKLAIGTLGPGETKRLILEHVRLSVSYNDVKGHVDKANRIYESNERNNRKYASSISMLRGSYCNNFTMDDVVVAEGGTATFKIVRGGGPGPREGQIVKWMLGDASAKGGSACSSRGVGPDFVSKSGTVTFGRYDTSKTVSTQVCKDRALEGEEYFTLILPIGSEPFGATYPHHYAKATIRR